MPNSLVVYPLTLLGGAFVSIDCCRIFGKR
jgi:hypothetical protein